MSTRKDLDNLLAKKQKWVDLYDRCNTCLTYLSEQFGGRAEANGDAYFRLINMHTGLSGGGGFWQGPDAESFARRLEELGTAVRDSENEFRNAILKIQKKAEKKTDDCNEEIRVCYEQMDDKGKASLLGDAIWDTIKDFCVGGFRKL